MAGTIRIAARNTRRHLKRSVLLAIAIAFGVLVITLVNAFTAGLAHGIRENFSYLFGGNVFIAGSVVSEAGQVTSRITDGERLAALLAEQLPTTPMQRRSRTQMTLIFGSRQASELVDGVDFARESALLDALPLVAGNLSALSNPQALVLTRRGADRLGVQIGDVVVARLLTVAGQNNIGDFTVAGIIEDGGSFGLTTAYANLPYLNELLGLAADEYQSANLYLADLGQADAVADRLEQTLLAQGFAVDRPLQVTPGSSGLDANLSGQQAVGQLLGVSLGGVTTERWQGTRYSITTINELLQPVQTTMTVLNAIAGGIFLLLLVITMVGITNTFRMVLIERTREIGTMRAFGMQRTTVRRIFLAEASVIALAGGLAGTILAWILAAVLSRISLVHVDGLQFFLDGGFFALPITAGGVLTNLVLVLLMALLAALFPANAAARLEPAKALGTHY